MIWFGFMGISTIVDYLMPNPIYRYTVVSKTKGQNLKT